MPNGDLVRDLVYTVILTSIVFTSVLIPLLEKVPSVRAFYAVIFRRRRTPMLRVAGRKVKEELVGDTERAVEPVGEGGREAENDGEGQER